jgi:hypothetical protein
VFASAHASAPAQLPATVAHPAPESHVAEQHTFVGPTAHVVDDAVHVHVSHAPSPLQ